MRNRAVTLAVVFAFMACSGPGSSQAAAIPGTTVSVGSLSPPTSLRVTGSSRTTITTAWHAVARATYYGLWRGSGQVGTTARSSFTFRGLACGKSYRLGVTARAGALASARSSVVAHTGSCPSPPHTTTPPAVAGSAEVGMALTVTSGMWAGVPAPTLSDQWLRCDSAGGGCIEITNATRGAYTPVAADEGSTIRVRVTATNGSGSLSVVSPQTPPVAAPSGAAPDVAPPTPPTAYTVPAGAISVSTSPQLIIALTHNTGKDIVLADGAYDNSSYFDDSNGNHVYAEHLGMARLNAGMALGKGAIVEGLVFDVSVAAKAVPGRKQLGAQHLGARRPGARYRGSGAHGDRTGPSRTVARRVGGPALQVL